MTVSLSNSFEGGTAGATVTTGNSGGASGNAFNTVSGSPKFGSAHAHAGSLALELPQGATWSTSQNLTWTFASEPIIYFRAYIFIPSGIWNNQNWYLAWFGNCYLAMQSTTAVTFYDNTISAGGPNSIFTGSLINKWWRIEAMTNNTAGQTAIKVFTSTPESDIPGSQVLTNFSTAAATSLIINTNVAGGTGAYLNGSAFMDDIAVSTTGWIGPSGAVSRAIPGITGGLRDRIAVNGSKRISGGSGITKADRIYLARYNSFPIYSSSGGSSGGGISVYTK